MANFSLHAHSLEHIVNCVIETRKEIKEFDDAMDDTDSAAVKSVLKKEKQNLLDYLREKSDEFDQMVKRSKAYERDNQTPSAPPTENPFIPDTPASGTSDIF